MLVELLKVGGITALAIGVLYLLYRQLLSMGIFPKLSKGYAFALLFTIVVLVFLVVLVTFNSADGLGIGSETTQVNTTNSIGSGANSVNTIITGGE